MVQWKPTGLSTFTAMAGGSIPSHKWHRVANTHPQNKIPKDTEKVESERMGRAMLDNNNQKKADVTNTRKKISKPKALLQIEFYFSSKEDAASL